MSAALSPEPDEPDGSGLPGDAEDGSPQGLYVTLPAEELNLEGFAEQGRTDTMAPGPLLGMVLDAVAGPGGEGLAGLSDDQLVGFLSGTRRMASRLEWARMAALAEFASRPRRDDFAADEVAAAFQLNWLSAAGEIEYAKAVSRRLPVTFASLAAGKLDAVHVRIIEDLTSVLSDEDAALADEILAGMAPSKTYAELRRAGNRLVLRLDPEAARKRKDKARREAHVRAFREQSGNAGITGREMPPAEVLASMQHVEDRARALRAAGVPGTWEELKVRATLDLLQERDSSARARRGAAPGFRRAGPAWRSRPGGPVAPGPVVPVRAAAPRLSPGSQCRRAGHHHRPRGRSRRQCRSGRRGRWVREPGPRRHARPDRRRRAQPRHPVVPDRLAPRRHRRRPRLRCRTPPVGTGGQDRRGHGRPGR